MCDKEYCDYSPKYERKGAWLRARLARQPCPLIAVVAHGVGRPHFAA